MVPFILIVAAAAIVVFTAVKLSSNRKGPGGKDYEDYFSENEKRSQ